MAHFADGTVQRNEHSDRLRRRDADSHEGKRMEPQTDRYYVFYTLSCRPYIRAARDAANHGKCREDNPAGDDRAKGLSRIVNALRVVAPELPFEIQYMEITEQEQSFGFDGFRITAFRVNHNVICYGYSIEIDRKGKFQLDKAMALGLDRRYWGKLQKGETVELPDGTYTPDMVMGEPRKGIKVTYCTDSRPTDSIIKNAKNADLFICEGMYGEPEKKTRQKSTNT